jgi:hypothetical protein
MSTMPLLWSSGLYKVDGFFGWFWKFRSVLKGELGNTALRSEFFVSQYLGGFPGRTKPLVFQTLKRVHRAWIVQTPIRGNVEIHGLHVCTLLLLLAAKTEKSTIK